MRRGLLASRDELSGLADRLGREPFNAFYDRLHRRCSLILKGSPITEPRWRSLYAQGRWGPAIGAARAAQGRIIDLLVAHHIDANRAYHDRAVEELRNLVSWSTWVDPSHKGLAVDLCTAEAAVAATVGLDWLWEDLSEADRLRVIRAIRDRVITPYHESVANDAWWYTAYHNWNAVVNSGCALAGLALGDELPEAEKVYELAHSGLEHFFDALGREGGWDEGTGYWGFALRYVMLLNEAADRVMDDQRLIHHRGMDTTGLFPIYFSPNGHAASFGDAPIVPLHGALYLLVSHFGLKEVAWWLDTYAFHNDVSTDGWSAGGLAMLFRPVDLDPPGPPELSEVKVFNEIGWASLCDHWPRPTMYVAAKAGDLAANHSQRDMNSIQLQVDGEMMLIDPDPGTSNGDSYADEGDELAEIQARSHNTMVVGERDHEIDARGQIVDAMDDAHYRYVACDAQQACGAGVHFLRHVVMIVDPAKATGRTLVVMDELRNTDAESVDLFWHTHGKVELHKKGRSAVLTGARAKLYAAFAATVPVHLSRESCGSRQRRNRAVRVSSPPVEQGVFVSVFSVEQLSGPVTVDAGGSALTVDTPMAMVRFKQRRNHWVLDTVELR
ncbi:MAG: heparinase II/III domain-containing protein [Planctomycetota bacterium]|jgi:hypothetical protein